MTAISKTSDIQLNSFREYGVNYLFHMTSLDNLKNIMTHGLYSHNLSRQLNVLQDDISDQDVNQKRAYINDPHFNRSLHDYVPFFINPRNAMLYALRNKQYYIAILAISINVLKNNKYLFTDGNAASHRTSFFNSSEHLSELNWNAIRAHYWNNFQDGKRIVNAEFLIPEKVGIEHISVIILHHPIVEKYLKNSLHHPKSTALLTLPFFFFNNF